MCAYNKRIELVVLQASSFCNINCRYCYLPDRKTTGLISDDILEEAIKKILQSPLVADEVMFLWHSGEPLVVGIPFYEAVLKLISKYNVNNKKIINAIQTNGILINQKWCDFLSKNNFRIGISLDGPEFLHDDNRLNWNGKGTFTKVMRCVSLLKENNIKLAAICVLSRKTLDFPNELFEFFLNNNFSRLSLVLEETIGENQASSLNENKNSFVSDEIKQKYAEFMSTLFKLWMPVKNKMYIREFAELCNLISRNIKNSSFDPQPQEVTALKILTVQKNGDLSTFCPELAGGVNNDKTLFTIGNVKAITKLENILQNANFLKIQKSINKGVENCKNSCDFFSLCGGRSPGIKMYETNSFESTITKHCLLHRQTLANTIITELSNFR